MEFKPHHLVGDNSKWCPEVCHPLQEKMGGRTFRVAVKHRNGVSSVSGLIHKRKEVLVFAGRCQDRDRIDVNSVKAICGPEDGLKMGMGAAVDFGNLAKMACVDSIFNLYTLSSLITPLDY